jgi:ABC-type polar amino acid transport system ATPase subunit
MVSTTMQLPGTILKSPTARPWTPVQAPEVVERQSSAPHPDWTVLENVIEPIAEMGASPTLAFQIAVDALDLLDLSALAGDRFEDLSTSQQHRVLIARTMTLQPSVGFDDWVDVMERLDRLTVAA